MRLYYKKNWFGAFLGLDYISKEKAFNYKIQKKFNKKVSIYKYGFIIEKNIEKIKIGQIYDPINDKVIEGNVQESFADIYVLQWKYPFYKKDFSLKEVSPADGYHEHSIREN